MVIKSLIHRDAELCFQNRIWWRISQTAFRISKTGYRRRLLITHFYIKPCPKNAFSDKNVSKNGSKLSLSFFSSKTSSFFGSKCFYGPKCFFLSKMFFGPKCFLVPNVFWSKKFIRPKCFFGWKCFWSKMFFGQKWFGGKYFLFGRKWLWPKIFLAEP